MKYTRKNKQYLTPSGKIKFVNLKEPDQFGKLGVSIELEKGAKGELMDLLRSKIKPDFLLPIKDDINEDKEPTGLKLLTARQPAVGKFGPAYIPILNEAQDKISEEISPGDIVRMKVTTYEYSFDKDGKKVEGLTLFLKGVILVEKGESKPKVDEPIDELNF